MTDKQRIAKALDAARERYNRLVARRSQGAVPAIEVAEAKAIYDALWREYRFTWNLPPVKET